MKTANRKGEEIGEDVTRVANAQRRRTKQSRAGVAYAARSARWERAFSSRVFMPRSSQMRFVSSSIAIAP